MKRIVFLDFDGVVMTSASYARAGRDRSAVARMDPSLVYNVNRLCVDLNAEVVLSTAWRGLDGVEEALYEHGITVPVVGKTPHLLSGYRGAEIRLWLDKNRPGWTKEDFVILDDNGDMEPFMDRWVPSTWADGFTDECLEKAREMWR